MKNKFLIITLLCFTSAIAQTKEHKYGITVGGAINHYNGNLGSSFFQPRTTCFAGVHATLGMYLNKSFDLNVGAGAGHFGYCNTQKDIDRLAHLDIKCPGCSDKVGMGELRSLMISGNLALKYKFANGKILKEDSKFAPYTYAGFGINHLADNMYKQCVNVGYHFTINAGAGLTYNITKRINIGYNLGIGYFLTKKVYNEGEIHPHELEDHHHELEKMDKRHDMIMQNSFTIGYNF